MYIYLDESGDLGFDFSKKKTTKFFVITFLFTRNKRQIEKCVRLAHRILRNKHKNVNSVLHATEEEPITRQRLLKKIASKDCDLMTIYLNKKRVYIKLQNEKSVLYNYVTNILLDRIITKKLIPLNETIHLIASKRETNKFLNENFSSYLKNQIGNTHKLKLNIEIKNPAEEKSLQAVDFVSWAIFRKLEYGDDSYYNMIKHKLIEENPLFP
ncbi:MAG: DUF3800 domain-containing protein [Candidatus Omnitrophota bacterium]